MSTNLVWHRKTLSNGLTVLLYPRQSANTAQLSIAVEYGSNQEPKKEAGIAHFLEHMLAGGSDKRIQRSRSVEDSGGVLDFYTDREHALGTMDILPQKLTSASKILSELFFDDGFDEGKFELERKIILNELAEVTDDPAVRVEELLLENLFREHPVKRPVGGYPKNVKRLNLNQLKQEHKLNYVPQNMILVLTGKFSTGDMQRVLEDFEKRNGEPELVKKNFVIEVFKPEKLVVEEKAGIKQTYLSIGCRTVCSSHKDSVALDLIGTLLGGGTSSRLFIELREKYAVTYDVAAAHCKGSDFGYFSVNCAVSNRKVDKARKLILKELADLRAQNISVEELERAKQIMLGGVLRGMDDPRDTTEIITYMEIQFRRASALQEYVERIKSVTSEDIRAAANLYLDENCLCSAIINPIK